MSKDEYIRHLERKIIKKDLENDQLRKALDDAHDSYKKIIQAIQNGVNVVPSPLVNRLEALYSKESVLMAMKEEREKNFEIFGRYLDFIANILLPLLNHCMLADGLAVAIHQAARGKTPLTKQLRETGEKIGMFIAKLRLEGAGLNIEKFINKTVNYADLRLFNIEHYLNTTDIKPLFQVVTETGNLLEGLRDEFQEILPTREPLKSTTYIGEQALAIRATQRKNNHATGLKIMRDLEALTDKTPIEIEALSRLQEAQKTRTIRDLINNCVSRSKKKLIRL